MNRSKAPIVRRYSAPDGTESLARYSPCERYRYWLQRVWADDPLARWLGFLMPNPSSATEKANDPTIERCERRARREGYGGLVICNLFAWRETYPREMKRVDEPIGPENDAAIDELLSLAAAGRVTVLGAWGANGDHRGRAAAVLSRMEDFGLRLQALGWTKYGHPAHPLPLRNDVKAVYRS